MPRLLTQGQSDGDVCLVGECSLWGRVDNNEFHLRRWYLRYLLDVQGELFNGQVDVRV